MNSDPTGEQAANQRPNLLAGQQLPPPPQQKRSKQKRDALLQAALSLFAERGYEATTIEDIAHRAGVAVGGFYQHFVSKQQLLLVLMDSLLEEIASFSSDLRITDTSQVHMLIEQVVRQGLLVDWSYAGALRAWREAIALDESLRTLQVQLEQWTARQIEMLFYPLLSISGARKDVDTTTLAWVVSILFWRLAETPLQDADAIVTAITAMMYHALYRD